MAKLVAVCRDDEFHFERRQIPLMIEETLTMVMEIPETVISAECVTEIDVSQFVKKYSCLSHREMTSALMVMKKDLFTLLSVSVPCVGCRRSVERLYNQLWQSRQPALEPLTISDNGVLTLSDEFLSNAKLIYTLFYIHGTHLNDVMDTIPKSKRNKRCLLHSLETHKAARASGWMDVWDLLSTECRDEVVLIDSDSLLDTLETYLRKHRFCSECKSKVLKAYSILAGDTDGDSEKGYCATLYEGLKSCPKERHIHVVCDTDFIAHLIGRAEPELAGGRRERHARTIDIAQEEVLTCLGIHLWERLHRLWQKLRAEEQTWQILFYLGVEALRKRFETAVEEKQGISMLELVVEEISEAEKAKEQRRENKRMKRKKRKENKSKLNEEKQSVPAEEKIETHENDEKCSEGTVSSIELEKDCFESMDDCSEKSSTDSQTSPGKSDVDPSPVSKTNPSSSPCSKSDTSQPNHRAKTSANDTTGCIGLLKPVEKIQKSGAEKVKIQVTQMERLDDNYEKLAIEKYQQTGKSTHEKCNSTACSSTPLKPCLNEKSKSNQLKTTTATPDDLSCKDCEQSQQDNSPWIKLHFNKKSSSESCKSSSSNTSNGGYHNSSNHSNHCTTNNNTHSRKHINNTSSGKNVDCECENNSSVNGAGKQTIHQKRNGYYTNNQQHENNRSHTNQTNNHYKNGPKIRNGCPTSSVGPRFSRYENQHRTWKSEDSTADACNNECAPSRGKGRQKGKPGYNKFKEGQPQWHNQSQNNHLSNHSKMHDVSSKNYNVEVEDEDELRLLQSMGWSITSEDSLSEQEIQEFRANKVDMQSQRQELRDKLRDQFQQLCVN